ncbi:MAG: DUF6504 family protein [Verrucomicrobiia bacterium]
MTRTFISEPILPDQESFDPQRMAHGEPGLPKKFTWRNEKFLITKVVAQWKEYGDCKHGSSDRYLRKHSYRLQTRDGVLLRVYFQRSFGKAKSTRTRWWLHSIEK